MQDNGHVLKPASQLIKYAHINLITDIFILVISDTIFKLEHSNLVQLELLTHWLTSIPGFLLSQNSNFADYLTRFPA